MQEKQWIVQNAKAKRRLKMGIVNQIYIFCLCKKTMECSKCRSINRVKRGIVGERQRYTCKDCGYNYTVMKKSSAKSDKMKRRALQLYLEGLGFRSIERFLGVSHVSVHQWIRLFGQKTEEIKSDQQIEVVEMDEMHTYIGSKKTIVARLPDRQGSGSLIEMGKGSSIAYLGIEAYKQGS